MSRAVLIPVGSHGSSQTLTIEGRLSRWPASVRKCNPVIDLTSFTWWKNSASNWNMISRKLNQSYLLQKLNMWFIRFGLENKDTFILQILLLMYSNSFNWSFQGSFIFLLTTVWALMFVAFYSTLDPFTPRYVNTARTPGMSFRWGDENKKISRELKKFTGDVTWLQGPLWQHLLHSDQIQAWGIRQLAANSREIHGLYKGEQSLIKMWFKQIKSWKCLAIWLWKETWRFY